MTQARMVILVLVTWILTHLVPAFAADPAALQPTSQPVAPKLPAFAIRRLGDLRLADVGARCGVFSSDNRRLITCGTDLTFWDAATGWQITQLRVRDHTGVGGSYFGPHRLAFAYNGIKQPSDILLFDEAGNCIRNIDRPWTGSFVEFAGAPDGSRFAVWADHLLLCDGPTGQTLRDLGAKPPHAGGGNLFNGPRFSFSADSKTLVAVTFDGQAHVIDAATDRDKIDHTFPATLGAAISGDGKTLAVMPDDHDLHLYDLPSGTELPLPPVETKATEDQPARRLAVRHIAFAAHAPLLAYSTDGPGSRINLLDLSARPLKAPRQISPTCMAGNPLILSEDGTLLAVADGFGRRIILKTATGEPIAPAAVSMHEISAMAVSPDGHELVAGNQQGELYRWDLEKGELLAHRERTTATDFTRNLIVNLSYFDHGQSLLEVGNPDARLCNAKTLSTETWLNIKNRGIYYGPVSTHVLSPDARFSVDRDGLNLILTDRKTQATTVLQHDDQPNAPSRLNAGAISPDGSLLYASCSEGPRFMDLITHQLGPVVRRNDTTTVGLTRVRFSPNSRWVTLQIGHSNAVYEARLLLETPAPTTGQQPVDIQVGGKRIPRQPISNAVPLWTCDAGDLFERDADFSSTSELMVFTGMTAADRHSEITIREVRSGKTLITLPPTAQVSILSRFVPGRPMMVSADHAGTVILWDLRAALLAAKDVGPGSVHGESADRLWDSISDPEPVHGYQAGMELLDRHLLISRAAVLSPLIPVNDQGNPGRIHLLIASLSSTVQSEREKAHKSLEGLGTAAIGQIRAALAAHPGGELEERLKDIAHVIGADDPATPTPPAISSAPPLADPQTLRTARVIQLLEWSDDPKAAEQLARLSPPLTGR